MEADDICRTDAKTKTKRGLKRKHHRAWTLSEVLKLVDGVAQFGPGKWSEIRRLSFASYSYRTSVDLKVGLLMQFLTHSLRFWSSNKSFCRLFRISGAI